MQPAGAASKGECLHGEPRPPQHGTDTTEERRHAAYRRGLKVDRATSWSRQEDLPALRTRPQMTATGSLQPARLPLARTHAQSSGGMARRSSCASCVKNPALSRRNFWTSSDPAEAPCALPACASADLPIARAEENKMADKLSQRPPCAATRAPTRWSARRPLSAPSFVTARRERASACPPESCSNWLIWASSVHPASPVGPSSGTAHRGVASGG